MQGPCVRRELCRHETPHKCTDAHAGALCEEGTVQAQDAAEVYRRACRGPGCVRRELCRHETLHKCTGAHAGALAV